MCNPEPDPAAEARASLVAWARAKGFSVREDRGWLILERDHQEPDSLVEVIEDLLKNRG
jgi:hypothetical protein